MNADKDGQCRVLCPDMVAYSVRVCTLSEWRGVLPELFRFPPSNQIAARTPALLPWTGQGCLVGAQDALTCFDFGNVSSPSGCDVVQLLGEDAFFRPRSVCSVARIRLLGHLVAALWCGVSRRRGRTRSRGDFGTSRE